MSPSASVSTYDRPVPVHTAVASDAVAMAFDRPVPVHSFSVSADASVVAYDRPTPVYVPVSSAHTGTYENVTTTDPTQLKVWDGTQWVRKPYYIWNGSTWVQVT